MPSRQIYLLSSNPGPLKRNPTQPLPLLLATHAPHHKGAGFSSKKSKRTKIKKYVRSNLWVGCWGNTETCKRVVVTSAQMRRQKTSYGPIPKLQKCTVHRKPVGWSGPLSAQHMLFLFSSKPRLDLLCRGEQKKVRSKVRENTGERDT